MDEVVINGETNELPDFESWWRVGYDNGWVGPPVCETHDGLPLTAEEDAQFGDGEDPCIHVVRLYESTEHKEQVEENHSPSVWRATNRIQ